MKNLIAATLLAALAWMPAAGQKLMHGDKAAELKVKDWVYGAPEKMDKPRLIEFFHSTSAPCLALLGKTGEMAAKYPALNVIVITREEREAVDKAIGTGNHPYYVALDDGGKTFAAYDVQYVPFSVLVDGRGRIVWFGNPSSLSDEIISKTVK